MDWGFSVLKTLIPQKQKQIMTFMKSKLFTNYF